VGLEAARALESEMNGGGSVDIYTSDQLLPFLALAGGRILAREFTGHAKSNVRIIEELMESPFDICKGESTAWFKVKVPLAHKI